MTARGPCQALRAYAERPDLSVDLREKAIFWIGQSGGAENEAFLRELYGRLKEESLREKVLFSVSQAGGQENARWLLGDRARTPTAAGAPQAGALLGRAERCVPWPT